MNAKEKGEDKNL